MTAYVVVTGHVDEKGFDQYRRAVLDSAVQGTLYNPGGKLSAIKGEWPMPGLVVSSVPAVRRRNNWYQSPAYPVIVTMRLKRAVGNFVRVNGA